MPEVEPSSSIAARKFPCPRCGAELVWSPSSKALQCRYCGFQHQAVAEGEVLEIFLNEALEQPKQLGWGTVRKSYRCSRCGAIETVSPELTASSCAFCGTPAVLEQPENQNLIRPQGVLPFQVSQQQALEQFRTWLRSLYFRPNNLAELAELGGTRGVYIPFYTFDADTVTHWTAESWQRDRSQGNSRTAWTRVSGTLSYRFDDLPVPASRGIQQALSRELEPYPTQNLVPYEPRYLAGFLAEEYGITLQEARKQAHRRMKEILRTVCRDAVPGKKCRNLKLKTTFTNEQFKTGLLPVWITPYQYKNKSFQYLVNGVTGKATGNAPWSQFKIKLALIMLVILLYWLAVW